MKSDLSCSSRAGDHRLMCGRGVLRSLGRMEETAKESGISDPAYHRRFESETEGLGCQKKGVGSAGSEELSP